MHNTRNGDGFSDFAQKLFQSSIMNALIAI
jgi:hypothetical protein